MCGIAGFSLVRNSKVNARALSHHLLSSIEWRGGMASGAAFHDPGRDEINIIKAPITGSNLPLKGMPRDTKTVILHTRLATQGSHQDNTNNHPLPGPAGDVVLVHNGVIWNDFSIRREALLPVADKLAEVDSIVIPALLEQRGLLGIKEISGDAAVAWLERGDTNALHLARIESSPVAYTNIEDGSFVFASTPELLRAGLEAAQIKHGHIFVQNELDYFVVRDGVIWNYMQTPEPEGFGMGYAAQWRNATSGNHAGESWWNDNPNALPDDEDYGWSDDTARRINEAWKGVSGGKPMYEDDFDDSEFDENGVYIGATGGPKFYTIDVYDNVMTYDSLDLLERALLHKAGMTTDGLGEGKSRWVNHFQDIGSFGFDGESQISWVDEPGELVYHEPASQDEGLGYIRDGVSLIKSMAGR